MIDDLPISDVHLVAAFPDLAAAQTALGVLAAERSVGHDRATLLTRDAVTAPGVRTLRVPEESRSDEDEQQVVRHLGRSALKGGAVGLAVGSVLGLVKGLTLGGSLGLDAYDPLAPVLGVAIGATYGALTGGLVLGYSSARSLAATDVLAGTGPFTLVLHLDRAEADGLSELLADHGAARVDVFDRHWTMLGQRALRSARERPRRATSA